MTREEAKEILTHNWTRVDNPNYSESELDEAFFMAIEALQADAVSLVGTMKYLTKPHNYCEVVRCKDCLFEQGCKQAQHLGMNGFCSHGERREP